jgi:FkbM family methyltransferase
MKILKSAIKKALWNAGYSVHERGHQVINEHSMQAALQRLAKNGVQPGCIFDVGAAQGTWSQAALQCWPAASYELFEPLHEQEPVLQALQKSHPNVNYHLAVAGKEPGAVRLNVSDDLDGSGIYGDESVNAREVPVLTIDSMAAKRKGPYLIKLDTHGFEVPVLEGALKTLPQTAALIIEVYGFKISPTCLLFHELSAWLDQKGFRLTDIVDVMRRPTDNAFWQADAVYVRKDSTIFQRNTYA